MSSETLNLTADSNVILLSFVSIEIMLAMSLHSEDGRLNYRQVMQLGYLCLLMCTL